MLETHDTFSNIQFLFLSGFKLIGDRYSVCTSENEEPAWVPDQPPTCQSNTSCLIWSV